MIRPDLLEALKKTNLTGWRAAEITYARQDGEIEGTTREPNGYPSMWYFQFRGKLKRRSKSFRNAKNACPHCGFGVLYCAGCEWHQTGKCPKCGKLAVQTPAAARNLKRPNIPLILNDTEFDRRGILEGEHWDGTDFIQISCGWGYGPFMDDRYVLTRRAVDWLVARHAAPLWAVPIPVDVSRMSQEQLRQLEMARDVRTVE